MIAHEQDPDVVRWGLHQLMNVCSFPNSSSESTVIQYEPDWSQVAYLKEGYCQKEQANVENDEVIAYALQEEFSKIAATEASGSFNMGQTSVLSQDWIHLSDRQHDSGDLGCEADQIGTDGSGGNEEIRGSGEMKVEGDDSCRRLNRAYGDGDDGDISLENQLDSLDITDEYSNLESEVGKRLNQMVPIPHIPKINGEFPTDDEEISDHQRLLDRLMLYDLVENKVQGDGNCQFRSLSDQLYRSAEHHKFVREQVVNQLKAQPEIYEGYVPMAYGDYLRKMSKNGEWGDHVTLQAAADSYGVKIFVVTSFKDTCYIEILPHVQKSERVIFLSFWAEVHYNSIYPEGDFPVVESKKKRKWWKL